MNADPVPDAVLRDLGVTHDKGLRAELARGLLELREAVRAMDESGAWVDGRPPVAFLLGLKAVRALLPPVSAEDEYRENALRGQVMDTATGPTDGEMVTIVAAPPGPVPHMWVLFSHNGSTPEWLDLGVASDDKWTIPCAGVAYEWRVSVDKPEAPRG